MYKRTTLYLVAGVLVIEAIAIVVFHSRIPRMARAIIAGMDLVAAAVLCLLAKQKKQG
jgi:hypothetical protein